mmetsp:Transcript_174682/g.560231  ORF Transcript_174682/g.560231 Transcript_174682/m.560231 type:complete len:101 (+) Transcript_174682:540-842(+)
MEFLAERGECRLHGTSNNRRSSSFLRCKAGCIDFKLKDAVRYISPRNESPLTSGADFSEQLGKNQCEDTGRANSNHTCWESEAATPPAHESEIRHQIPWG